MLENRIKRLAFERSRADKLTDLATEKAELLLSARKRNEKKMAEKYKFDMKRIEVQE